ncbi:hypothetical protein, partial [Acetomicrobium sp. S15 = DSM 107314]|uniref:hypothetical protein n=1 Tax=Acetomicrobium sp. S15 = DSM 107314 TaxID=2529858 RepID=UPI0018E1D6F5
GELYALLYIFKGGLAAFRLDLGELVFARLAYYAEGDEVYRVGIGALEALHGSFDNVAYGRIALFLLIDPNCSTYAFKSFFSYYSVSNAIKGNGFLVAVVVSLLSSMFLFKLADWMKRPHFKEWAL